MTEIIVGFVVSVCVFAAIWVLWMKKPKPKTDRTVFSCHQCNEQNCDCFQEKKEGERS
jgi:hypothetical protein